jgi:hypothetical protein
MTTGRINQVAIFVVAADFNSQRIACVLDLLLQSNHRQLPKQNFFLIFTTYPDMTQCLKNRQKVMKELSLDKDLASFQIKVTIGVDWKDQSRHLLPRLMFWGQLEHTLAFAVTMQMAFWVDQYNDVLEPKQLITWQQTPAKCCAQVIKNLHSWLGG